jgi:predicted nucleic-acid-binding protein
MRAIDTNAIVRLILRDDERQAVATERFIDGGAWVSLIVLAEVAWVVSAVYQRTHAQVAAGIEVLLEHDHLVVQDADIVAKAVVAYRKHPSVGFSDCLILEQARKAGHLPLGTFDRKLARLDGAVRL